MDVEKASSKGHGGGFLNLFDWRKKSKKRLFANGTASSPSSENVANGKEVDGSTPSSQSNLINEEILSTKGSSDQSCSSSVIDEEGHQRKGTGVVARLMGLDTMPEVSATESYLTTLNVSQSVGGKVYEERVAGAYIVLSKGAEGYPKKAMEFRSNNMPSSPIDRFRVDGLPVRSAKTFPIAQWLSPIKNHTNISGRNAADIMEAASRLIGSGFDTLGAYKVREYGYASPVHYNSRDVTRGPQLTPKIQRTPGKREELSSSRPPSGRPLNRKLNNFENTTSLRSSRLNGADTARSKVKGKAPSPVTQSVNLQGREGRSKYNRTVGSNKDPDERRMNEPSRSRSNLQKSQNPRRTTACASDTLVQNNRKQNSRVAKPQLNSKSAFSSQHRDKVRTIDASSSSEKMTTDDIRTRSVNGANKKEDLRPSNLANGTTTSSSKSISKTRKSTDGRRTYSGTSRSSDIVVKSSQRSIQQNIVIDEQSAWSKNNKRNSTEIVSFTFTSPVDKSIPGVRLPNYVVDREHMENGHSGSSSSNTANAKLDAIDGDYLSILLDRQLRELTSLSGSPYSKSAKSGESAAPSVASEDVASASESSSIVSAYHESESMNSFNDENVDISQTSVASQNDQTTENVDINNNKDQREPEHLHLGPLSILEAAASTETCSSSESWKSSNGTKLITFSEGRKAFDSFPLAKLPEVDTETQYSDTASSITAVTVEMMVSEISGSCRLDSHTQELEFIREILNATTSSDDICSYCLERYGHPEILDNLHSEELNATNAMRSQQRDEDGKDNTMRRKLLFDCINEFFHLKCIYYFNSGYRLWFKGVTFLGKLSAEEVYKEMTGRKVADESMVDELVDKEMSSPLGKWIDFEVESYEAGAEIEQELLSTLIDEMVADFLTEDWL